jgi:hypothetical protein
MALDDVYRIRFVWRNESDKPAAINDLYFRQDSVLILDTPGEDLWQAFQTSCQAAYTALVTNRLAIFQVFFGKAPVFETEFTVDEVVASGDLTGDAMPTVTCGLLSRYTATLSKRGRGRIFLPCANEANNGDGRPVSGYITALRDFGASMMPSIGDGIVTAGWTPMMWSPEDQVSREVTQWIARGYWGVQRDRRGLF